VCCCWLSITLITPERAYEAGDKLTVQQYADTETYDSAGPLSESVQVIMPTEDQIRPKLLDPIYAGEHRVRINNQISSTILRFLICTNTPDADCDESGIINLLGKRPASDSPSDSDISLGQTFISSCIEHFHNLPRTRRLETAKEKDILLNHLSVEMVVEPH